MWCVLGWHRLTMLPCFTNLNHLLDNRLTNQTGFMEFQPIKLKGPRSNSGNKTKEDRMFSQSNWIRHLQAGVSDCVVICEKANLVTMKQRLWLTSFLYHDVYPSDTASEIRRKCSSLFEWCVVSRACMGWLKMFLFDCTVTLTKPTVLELNEYVVRSQRCKLHILQLLLFENWGYLSHIVMFVHSTWHA